MLLPVYVVQYLLVDERAHQLYWNNGLEFFSVLSINNFLHVFILGIHNLYHISLSLCITVVCFCPFSIIFVSVANQEHSGPESFIYLALCCGIECFKITM